MMQVLKSKHVGEAYWTRTSDPNPVKPVLPACTERPTAQDVGRFGWINNTCQSGTYWIRTSDLCPVKAAL